MFSLGLGPAHPGEVGKGLCSYSCPTLASPLSWQHSPPRGGEIYPRACFGQESTAVSSQRLPAPQSHPASHLLMPCALSAWKPQGRSWQETEDTQF